MKNLTAAAVVICLLPVISSAAPRDWMQMSKNSQSAIYVDVGNLIRSGSKIHYWVLHDRTSGEQPKSLVMRNEVNCEVMEWRRVYVASYDDQMGKGNEKASVLSSAQWKPAVPEDSFVLAYPICDAFKQLDKKATPGILKN